MDAGLVAARKPRAVERGHSEPVQWYLNTLRGNAIERAVADIEVPPLDDSGMFEAGAMAYDQARAGSRTADRKRVSRAGRAAEAEAGRRNDFRG